MKTTMLKVCTLYFFVSLATNVRTSPISVDEYELTTEESYWENYVPSTATMTLKPPADDDKEIDSTTETVNHIEIFAMKSNEEYTNDASSSMTLVTGYRAETYDFSSRENIAYTDDQYNSSNSSTTTITPVTDYKAETYDFSSKENIAYMDDQYNSSNSTTTTITPVTDYKTETYDFSSIENFSRTDNTNFTNIMSTMPMPMDNKTENINSLKSEKTSYMDDNTNFSMINKSEGTNFFKNFSSTRVSSDYKVLKFSCSCNRIYSQMYDSLKLYISNLPRISDYIGNCVSIIFSSAEQIIKQIVNGLNFNFKMNFFQS
ncbi:Hypothetical protein CINCED_3A000497 [Cinara cedri]|uniref:Uncharacterized protein n=1 Tax=Cinara cedri TaxID=506608 RepID=A0A5E4LXY5_9HEMI|nr:Hypothetical protein CINCED_3A000497 [Cinara cedri]